MVSPRDRVQTRVSFEGQAIRNSQTCHSVCPLRSGHPQLSGLSQRVSFEGQAIHNSQVCHNVCPLKVRPSATLGLVSSGVAGGAAVTVELCSLLSFADFQQPTPPQVEVC